MLFVYIHLCFIEGNVSHRNLNPFYMSFFFKSLLNIASVVYVLVFWP